MEVPVSSIRVRAGVVLLKEDSILLVQHAKEDKEYWLLPGGGLDFGEIAEDAAKREVKEECGFDISVVKLLFVSEAISPDGKRHILNLTFLGEITGGELGVVCYDKRIKDIMFMPLSQIDNIKLYPNFKDELKNAIKNGFDNNNIYLGQLWE
ncbi:MAG: NUDIX hydrolase [Actinobacteria bacterium]|nr:NUDIX hydrolase [Actinomycetota bacterium]